MNSILFIDENMSLGQMLWESRIKALNILSGLTWVANDWEILVILMIAKTMNQEKTNKLWKGEDESIGSMGEDCFKREEDLSFVAM